MKYSNVLVVGGSGFIGRHLVASLAAAGVRVTVPARRRERAKHLILLPTVDVVETDIMAPGELERLCAGRHAVYNLVGILHSRRGARAERGVNEYGPDFARMHVELPQAIVTACRAQGVHRVLHVSALNASPTAPSEYLRSKGIGEQALLAADDLDVTVFRPSVVFGPEDTFLNRFATFARLSPVFAVPCPEAKFQPVYVGDVARALHFALEEPEAPGKVYELCGPDVVSMKELVRFVCAVTGRRRWIFGLPDRLSYMQAWTLEHLPGKLMTRDNYRSMQVPSTCDAPFPFRLQPQSLEAVAPGYLAPAGPRERYPQLRWRARR
ncbi:MAG TPA: complex I NDUFA9 subunit family protein [Burkholderiales bacterium]